MLTLPFGAVQAVLEDATPVIAGKKEVLLTVVACTAVHPLSPVTVTI